MINKIIPYLFLVSSFNIFAQDNFQIRVHCRETRGFHVAGNCVNVHVYQPGWRPKIVTIQLDQLSDGSTFGYWNKTIESEVKGLIKCKLNVQEMNHAFGLWSISASITNGSDKNSFNIELPESDNYFPRISTSVIDSDTCFGAEVIVESV